MTKELDPARARELKQKLRTLAAKEGVDLSLPDNKWTLWWWNGSQLFFNGSAPSLTELYGLTARKMGYMFHMFEDALILEAQGPDEFIVREYSCSKG